MNLKDELFILLKDSCTGLWKKEDEDFLRQLAGDIVSEKLAMITSDNSIVHQQNLLHLAATLETEIAIKKIAVEKHSKALFVGIVSAIIRTIALQALKL